MQEEGSIAASNVHAYGDLHTGGASGALPQPAARGIWGKGTIWTNEGPVTHALIHSLWCFILIALQVLWKCEAWGSYTTLTQPCLAQCLLRLPKSAVYPLLRGTFVGDLIHIKTEETQNQTAFLFCTSKGLKVQFRAHVSRTRLHWMQWDLLLINHAETRIVNVLCSLTS